MRECVEGVKGGAECDIESSGIGRNADGERGAECVCGVRGGGRARRGPRRALRVESVLY